MELLSSANMFNSAFLGLPASLIGFLLLLVWGGMIILGVRVERPAYKMIGIVLTALCLSMLLGLYDVGARTGSNAGGIFGNWIGVRCAGSGVLALVYLLLWVAFPTGLLLATDWLFFRYLFGRQKPLLAMSGASDFFAEGKKLINSLGFFGIRSTKFRPKPRSKKRPAESDLVAGLETDLKNDVKTMSQATMVESKQRRGLGYADPAVRPMGSSTAGDMPPTETWRSGWRTEQDEPADAFDAAGADEDIDSISDETVIRLTAVAEPEVENISKEAIGLEAAEAIESAGWPGGFFGPTLDSEEEPLPSSPVSVSDEETAESSDETTWWKSDSLSEETPDSPESDLTESDDDEPSAGAEATDRLEEPVEEPVAAHHEDKTEEAEAESGEAVDVMLDKSWWTPPAEPLESAVHPRDDVEDDVEESCDDDSDDDAEISEAPGEEPSELEITSDHEEVEEDQMDSISPEVEESVIEEATVRAEATIDAAVDMAHAPEPQAEFSFDAPLQAGGGHEINEEEERLFKNAVSVVVREKKGSISLLQKELGLGYFRAAKLLNILESRNVIAPYAGSIARKVVISDEEAERIVSEESL